MTECRSCLWWGPNQPVRSPEEPLRWCRRHKTETDDGHSCESFMGADSTEANVPQHTSGGTDMPIDPVPVPGPVHILIVTYEKDLPWLHYCLRSIEKFTKGFQGTTIAFPRHSEEAFRKTTEGFDVELFPYNETKGKGFVQHEAMMGKADLICPGSAYVLHMDSDCIFTTPTGPEHYFTAGLPQYLYRSYESLSEEDPLRPGSKVISDCVQWLKPTEAQLGFKVPHAYTMCRHPTVFPGTFYPAYRAHIEKVHGKRFMDYFMEGRNEFPQDRMDFTAMGAFAFYRMKAAFRWIDICREPYPKDRMKAFWSHGGITPEIRRELESLLS